MKPSKAALREAEAIAMLQEASNLIFQATGKFRADSGATVMTGQLVAARMIVDAVRKRVEERTTD